MHVVLIPSISHVLGWLCLGHPGWHLVGIHGIVHGCVSEVGVVFLRMAFVILSYVFWRKGSFICACGKICWIGDIVEIGSRGSQNALRRLSMVRLLVRKPLCSFWLHWYRLGLVKTFRVYRRWGVGYVYRSWRWRERCGTYLVWSNWGVCMHERNNLAMCTYSFLRVVEFLLYYRACHCLKVVVMFFRWVMSLGLISCHLNSRGTKWK